jgi:arylsulfatase A-like enzyme
MSTELSAGSRILVCAISALALGCAGPEGDADGSSDAAATGHSAGAQPNVILILADDLGWGELGSYGQTRILTPVLDRLAEEGVRFTQHYAGSPVCAPSRDVLLTGLHSGHAYIRDNDELSERGDVWGDTTIEGQRPILPDTYTLGRLFQDAGYATGAIGKWGLGGPGSSGEPNRQGFDHWYGYLCQREAHNYYPTHLWRNGEKAPLKGNSYFKAHQRLPESADPGDPMEYADFSGQTYAMDAMADEALRFIRDHRAEPFFLYLPFPVPHLALQVPDSSVAEYRGTFPETPYVGDRGYLPHPEPRAAYAAMITRMDSEIGRILDLLSELGLDEQTLVLFTSDNGPSWVGGVDREFFGSTGGLRGRKAQLREGGIRVPLIAWWPGRAPAGETSDHISGFADYMATFSELLGVQQESGETDGVSFFPTISGRGTEQARAPWLYWEFHGAQAVRFGDWKAFRERADSPLELYDLASDPEETTDLGSVHPDLVTEAEAILADARTESVLFPLVPEEE